MCDKKPFGRLAETSAVRHSLEGVPVDAVADVMGRLISQGLIRGWGMSQVSAETLAKAHKVTAVSAVQNLYSMLERDCEKEIFPYCLEHGIGVVPFSPIASGFLSGKVSAETKFEGDDVRRWVPQLSKENILANQPILDVLSDCARKKRSHKRAAFSRVDAPRKVSHKTGGAKRSKANHKKQARP